MVLIGQPTRNGKRVVYRSPADEPRRRLRSASTSATTSKCLDDGVFDIEARRRPHEKIAQHTIVGGNDLLTVDPVAIEEPLRQQQGCALVSLSKTLRPSNAVGENGSGVDRVLDLIDGSKRPLNPVEIVRLIEPLVNITNGAVESDGNRDCRAPQCSRR